MSNIRIFIDFGSTFTKAVAFDLDGEELVARVQVPSTVDSDITLGLEGALEKLAQELKIGDAERRQTVACSSAAGGLRVVCLGLVTEFTTEAARLAALGAGAKIVGVYSYELSQSEVAEIEEIAPDIILLTGGTNGGNKKVIINNAKILAKAGNRVSNIIVAGNKSAYDEIKAAFAATNKNVIYTNNVMPEIGKIDVDSSNKKIRELFINHITQAKGITRAKTLINDVIMPTPSAVLEAAKLIADGLPDNPGLGELLLIDVGGATTDVYSIARGNPTQDGISTIGLPEPYAKRTVEGDLGLVHNVETLAEIANNGQFPESFAETVKAISEAGKIPTCQEEVDCHLLLSHLAVKTAVERHVGRLEVQVFSTGSMKAQRGKDLTPVRLVIGAGGPVAFSSNPQQVLGGALFQQEVPALLKPRAPEFMLDKNYILFAIGLLARNEPTKALNIVKKYLVRL
ncbi:MAG: methylaspartate mutase accessory protein GlmL [Clostridia bacterium]|nr:methylaspartate mutase accessory protein GlmL [Clostridia bacterium]